MKAHFLSYKVFEEEETLIMDIANKGSSPLILLPERLKQL